MLEHGRPGAAAFLSQLANATVTPWRCACGCASINFAIRGCSEPHGGLNLLSDFLFGAEVELSGIFVYEQGGVLSGAEVYGLAGEAPRSLPSVESLKPFGQPAA